MERTILHCDFNNFYASVECFRNPKWKPFPVAVCGDTEERHGIVLAKNYKAKYFGVKTGEAIWQAKQKCPDLLTVPPHYDDYLKFSKAAREIYSEYTDKIEPFGMDENWLDVTSSRELFGSGEQIAEELRKRVQYELGLTISVGVSFNKIFAKLGSDMKKPNAVTVIPKDRFKEIVFPLPASDMLGVGRATMRKIGDFGIRTIGDIATWPKDFFTRTLGKNGTALWNFANGLDESEVKSVEYEMPMKSVGHGITMLQDLENTAEVWKTILELSQDLGHSLHKYDKWATGVAVSIKDDRLFTKEWQCPLKEATKSASEIASTAFQLFFQKYDWLHPIRAVTVRAIGLRKDPLSTQMDLFTDWTAKEKKERLDEAVEEIRNRFGKNIIRNACLLDNPKMPRDHECKVIMPTGVPI